MPFDPVLAGLFVSAFLSSTILPGTSEAALVVIVAGDASRLAPAIAVATAGNTLGGLTSYAIGRFVPQPKSTPRALSLARRYGVVALLLSWVPVVGDGLCIASGWLRHDPLAATVMMAIGKLARYLVVAYAARAVSG
jgi:membrane protein YqaA with SNARE-associated domain